MDSKKIADKLNSLKKKYEREMYYFKIFVESDCTSSCFERNAISKLTFLNELKSKIEVLENLYHEVSLLESLND